jgi:hypothetical protein
MLTVPWRRPCRPIRDVDAAAAMGRDAAMSRIWIVAIATLGLIGLGDCVGTALAAPKGAAPKGASDHGRASASDLSSQRRVRRAPVRITVYPTYRRLIAPRTHDFDIYPSQYPYAWPGPFAKRDCIGWLAAEARPSGPVVVPRQRCWWTPG